MSKSGPNSVPELARDRPNLGWDRPSCADIDRVGGQLWSTSANSGPESTRFGPSSTEVGPESTLKWPRVRQGPPGADGTEITLERLLSSAAPAPAKARTDRMEQLDRCPEQEHMFAEVPRGVHRCCSSAIPMFLWPAELGRTRPIRPEFGPMLAKVGSVVPCFAKLGRDRPASARVGPSSTRGLPTFTTNTEPEWPRSIEIGRRESQNWPTNRPSSANLG